METTDTQAVRKVRRLTKAEVSAIRVQYDAGARQVDLAAAFGVNQSTISRLVRPAGVDLRRRKEAA